MIGTAVKVNSRLRHQMAPLAQHSRSASRKTKTLEHPFSWRGCSTGLNTALFPCPTSCQGGGGEFLELTSLCELNLVAQMAKSLPAMQETWVQSLGWEDPLEKEMATHSSIHAWRIPWTERPGGLQSMSSQRVRHD